MFRSVTFPRTSVDLFRWLLGFYLLAYYLRFAPDLEYYFGVKGQVARHMLGDFDFPSLLLLVPLNWFLWLCFALLLGLIPLMMVGRLSRPWLGLLFVLNLSFHNANPYIIHEPQQLASLFLLLLAVFLPTRYGEQADPYLIWILIVALGTYYFLAGIKKLPDPLWRSGEAVGHILEWGAVGGENWSAFVLNHDWLNRVLTYGVLLFEFCFLFLALSRWRYLVAGIGIFFHLALAFSLDVGMFAEIMFVWYALLWRAPHLKLSTSSA